MATLGSVGIGSGVLTSDILDKLKEADRTTQVNPIDRSIEKNTQKTEALDLLKSLTSSLKGSTSSLKDSSLYQKRVVSGNNDTVSVSAKDGVGIQDFSVKDVKLAYKNVIQSGSFSSSDDKVASGDGTLNLNIDGTDYKIDYTSDMSYNDLKNKINDVAGSKVSASILQTGDDEYSFVITSDETGKDQQIGLVDLGGNLDTSLKSDILKSDAFDDKDDAIASGDGSLTLNAGGKDFTFDYTDSTTLVDLAKMINDDADASQQVYASVIKDKNDKYELVLTAKNPAEDQSISISDNDSNLSTKLTDDATSDSGDIKDIQTSRDASFKYNGISMTRSKNTIDDIQLGLEIKLLKDDGNANISIKQDTQPIKDELENFVNSYNTFQKQLDSMTLADLDNKKVGIFNGDNSINNIGRSIKKLLTSRDSNTNEGLSQFGVSLDRTGKLSFDSSAFDEKMKNDPEGVASFFSGETKVVGDRTTHKEGFFNKLYDNLKGLTVAGGSITAISDGLSKEGKQLEENRTEALKALNAKYDTMTSRFIQYDSMINSLNNQFSVLQQQIEMAVNAK